MKKQSQAIQNKAKPMQAHPKPSNNNRNKCKNKQIHRNQSKTKAKQFKSIQNQPVKQSETDTNQCKNK